MTPDLTYVPRKKLVEALESGLRLLPDVEYYELDWAILMYQPVPPIAMTAEQIKRAASKFEYAPPAPRSTHCKYGHFLGGDNLYIRADGHRGCQTCRQRRRKAEAAKLRQEREYA